MFLATAVKEGLPLSHFGMEQVYVRSDVDAEGPLRFPSGCGPLSQEVVKLNKATYGLKQASRSWSLLPTLKLESFRFEQSLSDSCIFRLFEEGSKGKLKMVIIAYSVDDLIVAGTMNKPKRSGNSEPLFSHKEYWRIGRAEGLFGVKGLG